MEELVGLVGFSLGASMAIGAVRSVARGSQPVVREAFKMGLRAWDSVASATEAARQGAANLGGDAQEASRSRARRRRGPEKIIIAHE